MSRSGARILLFAALACSGTPARALLSPGSAHERSLVGSQSVELVLNLAAGQFAAVTLEQRGIDLRLAIEGPRGSGLSLAADHLRAARGSEWLPWVAPRAGEYLVRVSAARPGNHVGQFVLRATTPRAASAEDRATSQAMAQVSEGDRRARAGLEASLAAAASCYERAATMAPPGSRAEAIALASLARARERSDHAVTSEAAYERALQAAIQTGDATAATLHRVAIADLAGLRGDAQRSHALATEAVRAAQAALDPIVHGRALLVLADLANDRDDSVEEVRLLSRARELFTLGGDSALDGYALKSLGDSFQRRGDLQRALTLHTRALAAFERDGDLVGQGSALHSLGTVRVDIDRHRDRAAPYFERAVRVFRAAGDLRSLPFSLDAVGITQRERGQIDAAIATTQEALVLRRKAGVPRGEAQSLEALGNALSMRGNHREALSALHEALATMRRLGDPSLEARALYYLARAEAAAGDDEAALGHVGEALAITDRRLRAIGADESRALLGAQRRSYADLRVALLMDARAQAGDSPPPSDLAFAASEASRAQALRDRLGLAFLAMRRDTPPALRAAERASREHLLALEASYVRRSREQGSFEELARLDADIAHARARHQAELMNAARGAPDPDSRSLFPADVQPLLADDTLLLVYHVGAHGSFVWAITRTTARAEPLPPAKILNALAHQLREEMGAREVTPGGESAEARRSRIAKADAAWEAAATQASRTLLGPVAELGSYRRIVIAPDDALHSVPFAALPLPETTVAQAVTATRRMVSDHAIVMVPSADVLRILAQRPHRRRIATGSFLVLADAVYSADDPRLGPAGPVSPAETERGNRRRLPFSRREAERLAELLPRERLTTLLDFAASREHVLSAGLGRHAVVHLAAHADLDERPFSTAIYLSRLDRQGTPIADTLRLDDVYGLDLDAELVVLSACRSALGHEVRGEGMMGLARGLLAAGAHRVMGSAWPVHDRATAELVSRFYEALLGDGQDVPAALQSAQASMAEDPRWSAPYYWAAFSLFGLP